jgi:hypothetical protein
LQRECCCVDAVDAVEGAAHGGDTVDAVQAVLEQQMGGEQQAAAREDRISANDTCGKATGKPIFACKQVMWQVSFTGRLVDQHSRHFAQLASQTSVKL